MFEDSEVRKNNLIFDALFDKVKLGILREKELKVDCADGLFSKGNEKLGFIDFLNYLVIILL